MSSTLNQSSSRANSCVIETVGALQRLPGTVLLPLEIFRVWSREQSWSDIRDNKINTGSLKY